MFILDSKYIILAPEVNFCISEALRQLEQETCLQFSNRSAPTTETVISFVDSGWVF